MKGYRILILILTALLLQSCGSKEDGSTVSEKTAMNESIQAAATDQKPRSEMTEEEKIMADMTNLMDRIAEGDKSVLYENEFTYYRDETPLSEYWKEYKVYNYKYDTLAGITYDSVKILGDSAKVWAKIVYTSKAGAGTSKVDYNFIMYKFMGDRWIKPYVSVAGSARELEYLENIRRYEEEAGE